MKSPYFLNNEEQLDMARAMTRIVDVVVELRKEIEKQRSILASLKHETELMHDAFLLHVLPANAPIPFESKN